MRRFFSAFFIFFSLLAPAGSFFLIPQKVAAANIKILFVGDSQGDGLSRPLRSLLTSSGFDVVGDETWVSWRTRYFFSGRPNSPACGAGFQCRPPGDLSQSTIPDILQGVVDRTHPDVVLFMLGGNDYANSSLSSDIRRVVQIAKSSASKVIWVGTAHSEDPAVETRHRAVAGVQQSTLAALGDNVIWIDGVSGSQPGPYTSPGVHLTAAGYSRWANELVPEIIRLAGGDASALPASGAAGGTTGATGAGDLGAIAAPCPVAPASLLPIQLGVRIGTLGEVNGLADYINVIYRYLVSIVLIVAIVMVVYGGFRYLVGAGVGGVERGKEIIRDAIMGMLVVLGAYVILQTVNPATVSLSGIQPTSVGCTEPNIDAVNVFRTTNPDCQQDSDCGEGKHCIPTRWVFQNNVEEAGYAAAGVGAVIGSPGLLPGAIAGGSAGYVVGVLTDLGRTIHACSDGKNGSPCGETSDCTETGSVCSEGWNICIKSNNNPPGSPCDTDEQCAAPAGGATSCTGSDDYTVCRGSVLNFTVADFRMINFNLNNLPQALSCFRDHDCSEPGAKCLGPSGTPHRFCSASVEQAENGSLCFLSASEVPLPVSCSGHGDARFTCVVCPAAGARVWQVLDHNTDPNHVRVGACKPRESVGTSCVGGSS